MSLDLERLQSFPLILIRGLPGVGKSTLARRAFPQRFLIEADHFFVTAGGTYQWQAALTSSAHSWCLTTTEAHLTVRHQVVVANTFVTRLALSPYFRLLTQLGRTPWQYKVAVITVGHGRLTLADLAHRTGASGHQVPLHVIEKMAAAWEGCEDEIFSDKEHVPDAPPWREEPTHAE